MHIRRMASTTMIMVVFLPVLMLSLCECRHHKPPRPPFHYYSIAKKGLCPEGGGDKHAGCEQWKKQGYCTPGHLYFDFVSTNCPASCGICQARPTPPPRARAVRVNIKECLKAHNAVRALHRARPLTWNRTLARNAQAWALDLAKRDKFEHDRVRGEGENLYYSVASSGKRATCKDALEAWYGEVSDYPFSHPPKSIFDIPGVQIGHFTQVVWKSTRQLGVGIASIKRGHWTKTYVVARYTPPGNYWGRFKEEVGDITALY
ncbi:ectin-like isoform X1 [Stylophora pistillata]|uniref:ectin-like isoform X1 n=1 Tax=Stylophora pistillata TaxID=50429 RepID=UPI000C042F45|nr:ectin-like isoform X1 [Stylophora pistillata]